MSKPELKPCPFCGEKPIFLNEPSAALNPLHQFDCAATRGARKAALESRASMIPAAPMVARAVNSQDELVQALKAVRFNLITFAGYKVNSIMIEGIDATLAKARGE